MNTILENLLRRLIGVIPYRDTFKALCPSHPDTNQSLNIKPGHSGLLLKCWAGCSFDQIIAALGLSPSDVFYDQFTTNPFASKRLVDEPLFRPYRWDWRKACNELEIIADVRRVLAEDFMKSLKEFDGSSLTDDHRDFLMNKIALARRWIELGESVDELVYDIRSMMRARETSQW